MYSIKSIKHDPRIRHVHIRYVFVLDTDTISIFMVKLYCIIFLKLLFVSKYLYCIVPEVYVCVIVS
jgi:hypothetical protein